MVVVVVGDDDSVDCGDVLDITGSRGVAFRAQPGEGRAAVFKYWIEENPETGWKLDEVAGVPKPCCA